MIAVTSKAALAVRRMTNTDTYPQAGLSIRKIDDDKFAFSIVPNRTSSDVAVPGTNVTWTGQPPPPWNTPHSTPTRTPPSPGSSYWTRQVPEEPRHSGAVRIGDAAPLRCEISRRAD
ncbi:hypothetical protein [Actinoplanes sp. NPDC026623]|uniref:hypothetical protein n=1 Tax=Actinoplanes sp. NPDC026623 TaxID=3155610 RepID=UPI0033E16CA2